MRWSLQTKSVTDCLGVCVQEGGETAPPATFTGTKRNGQIPTHRASAKHGTGGIMS